MHEKETCQTKGHREMDLEGATMKRSRLFLSFAVAGFQRYDGALVFNQLSVGSGLSLVPELDNPYDPCAMALYFDEAMIGYVPRDLNEELSQLFYFGHGDVFEARVLQVNPEKEPWKQVRVGIYVKDKSVGQ